MTAIVFKAKNGKWYIMVSGDKKREFFGPFGDKQESLKALKGKFGGMEFSVDESGTAVAPSSPKEITAGVSDKQFKLEVTIWAEVDGEENIEKFRQNLLDMVTDAEVSGRLQKGTGATLIDVSCDARVKNRMANAKWAATQAWDEACESAKKRLAEAGIEVVRIKASDMLKASDMPKAVTALASSDNLGEYADLIFVAGVKVGMKLDVRSYSGSIIEEPFQEKYAVHTLDDGPFYVVFSIDSEQVDEAYPDLNMQIIDKKGILGTKNSKALTKSILNLMPKGRSTLASSDKQHSKKASWDQKLQTMFNKIHALDHKLEKLTIEKDSDPGVVFLGFVYDGENKEDYSDLPEPLQAKAEAIFDYVERHGLKIWGDIDGVWKIRPT